MRGQCNRGHGPDIRRHLGDYRNLDGALDECGVVGNKFRILANVAAHAGVAHLRAGEIQLYRVDSCLLGHFCQPGPFILVLPHY